MLHPKINLIGHLYFIFFKTLAPSEKEKELDLHQKEQLLKRTEAQNRKAELEQKRKMEDHHRMLKLETERKIAETNSRAQKEMSEKDNKLSRLRVKFTR